VAAVRILVDTDVFIDYFNTGRYTDIRTPGRPPSITPWLRAKSYSAEDALIAATALDKRLPLMTGNWRHFRHVEGLRRYP